MSKGTKNAVTPETVENEVSEATEATEVVAAPEVGVASEEPQETEKAVMANLDSWEAAPLRGQPPVEGRAPVKVEKFPNGIVATHF